ncbi:MAG: hypothetical protein BGO98_24195 [Myxococcales bacterium 68-20]|nr:hypothetical protein [Myxococcales bacterium]OJY15774.1 MAG: hypothetical protein BGO98_24195 [Myxococcales bacterium 68-20]
MTSHAFPTNRRPRGVAIAILGGPLSVALLASSACAVADDQGGDLDPDSGIVVPAPDTGDEVSLADAGTDAPETESPNLPCAVGNLCRVETPLTLGSVASLSGRSKDDVWAGASRGVVMHWNGQKWTALESNIDETLSSLFLTAEETWGVAGELLVRRGIEASSVRTFRNPAIFLGGMSGVAVLGNGDTYASLLSPPSVPGFPLALLQITDFDNVGIDVAPAPVLEASGQPQSLATRALFLVPDRVLWLVGSYGSVARYPVSAGLGDGVVMPVASQADLFGAWGQDDHLWAAGSGGTILHFDGTGWTIEDTGTNVALNAIFGFGLNDIWAAGDEGTVLHFDGQRWSQVEIGGYRGQLKAIWGAAPDDVWFGGERAMFHWGALP